MDDQHLRPDLRAGVATPWEVAGVLLGERFGKWPWELDDQPARTVTRCLAVLSAMTEAANLNYGLPDDERVIRFRGDGTSDV